MFALSTPLGITIKQAQDYAVGISRYVLLEAKGVSDKEKADTIVTAVINLTLPSIADEKQVITLLPTMGVEQNVADMALKSLPPYEDNTGTKMTPTVRAEVARSNVKKVAAMSTGVKVALGVSLVALVGSLVMIGKNRREAV